MRKLVVTMAEAESQLYDIHYKNLMRSLNDPPLYAEVELRRIANVCSPTAAVRVAFAFFHTELRGHLELYARWCAERTRPLMDSAPIIEALDTLKRYQEKTATLRELLLAREAAQRALYALGSAVSAVNFEVARGPESFPAENASRKAILASSADVDRLSRNEEAKAQYLEFIRLIDCYEKGVEYKI